MRRNIDAIFLGPAQRLRYLFWARAWCFMLGVASIQASGCSRQQTGTTGAAAPITLHVASDGELLAFDPTQLSCPTGARVRVVFHHAGQRLPQDHNWVLLQPGSSDDIMQAAVAAGQSAGFVPRDSRVLAATALCGRGGEAAVEFTAPAPGDYPFLCTFPGHGAVMNGVLHVTTR